MSVVEQLTGDAAVPPERPRTFAVEPRDRDDGPDRTARLKLVAPIGPRPV